MAPAAAATFSPKGMGGDLISGVSLMGGGYRPFESVGVGGYEGVPFSDGRSGVAFDNSDVVCDELYGRGHRTKLRSTVSNRDITNRRFLFGMSGEVLFDFPGPLNDTDEAV